MVAEQWLLLVGATAFIIYLISLNFHPKKLAPALAASGCTAIAAALSMQLILTGRAPWASLYEIAALLALILGLFLLVSTLKGEPRSLRLMLAIVPIILLIFSAFTWKSSAALPDSLASGWLLVHVPVAIASYGLFTCSAAASTAYLYYARNKSGKSDLERLDRISLICTAGGLILLVTAIAMGSLWAKVAWGSYWSWDPKEIWSLITVFIYGLYLSLRLRGMKGEEAAYISIVGFLCVIFTCLGVSYLIPGLHSYA